MFKTVIHIYGLPREISTTREVEVELKDGAGMADVVAALREKVPALEGQVIRAGGDRLMDYFKFNINGRFSGVQRSNRCRACRRRDVDDSQASAMIRQVGEAPRHSNVVNGALRGDCTGANVKYFTCSRCCP